MSGSLVARLWLAVWLLALLVLAAGVPSEAAPVPALEFRFFDAVGSIVPNHGWLGTAGDGTLSGGATVGNGGQGFDPTRSGYINITSNTALMSTADLDVLDLATDLTLSYWVKPTVTTGTWREMFGDCTRSTSDHGGWYTQGMDLGTRNRAIVLVGYETGTGDSFYYNYSGDNWLIPDEWQQLTIVLKNIGVTGSHSWTADFYRNGMWHSSFTSPATIYPMKNRPDGFKIGDTHWDASLLAQYGMVAVFDTALTADQVREYYFAALPEPSAFALLGLGGIGLAAYFLRRGRR